ncbi:hypothetical protein predicted by Glimmer/Critica [Salmonella enterica subsp. enterica serovar Weltevreden str. 2007-60-3289-1]|nr:hypothetical protein predicted by Glimmer/Critica [Salmonella enterica subsp. enterica serovar Weltevreden str. 2007-60-3289-1]
MGFKGQRHFISPDSRESLWSLCLPPTGCSFA